MLFAKLDEGMAVKEALHQVTLKNVAYLFASIWDEVKNTTTQKSWKNIFGICGHTPKVQEHYNLSVLTTCTRSSSQSGTC